MGNVSTRVREHLRTNVVGYVAIFLFAVGGTAYATHPGGDDTIDSGDIVNGQVRTNDISNANGVRSADVRDDTLSGGGLTAADLGPASVGTAEVGSNALRGEDIFEPSLRFLTEEDTNGSCSPAGATAVICASVDLPSFDSQVLAFATLQWRSDVGGADGSCSFFLDDVRLINSAVNIGEKENTTDNNHTDSLTLIDVISIDPDDPNVLTVRCDEREAELILNNVELTALVL